jgi:hypothetical protein
MQEEVKLLGNMISVSYVQCQSEVTALQGMCSGHE